MHKRIRILKHIRVDWLLNPIKRNTDYLKKAQEPGTGGSSNPGRWSKVHGP